MAFSPTIQPAAASSVTNAHDEILTCLVLLTIQLLELGADRTLPETPAKALAGAICTAERASRDAHSGEAARQHTSCPAVNKGRSCGLPRSSKADT